MQPLIWSLLGALAVIAAMVLFNRYASFRAQSSEDYEDHPGDAFDLRRHLSGPLICEGVIFGPTGRVSSRFVGDFDVHWEGNVGTMRERFEYESGSVQNREWRLVLGNDGRIKATAPDVIGEGSGQQTGSAVRLNYRIKLPEDSGGHVLDTVDWMYLAPNGTIVNRSQFRKFGIKVAELVATMRQKEAA